jgi:hypothetical protein
MSLPPIRGTSKTKIAKHPETGRGRTAGGRRGAGGNPTPAAPRLQMLRNSERSTLKRCEWLWDMTYNQRLKPVTEMPALRYGSLVHKALADYYIPGVKRGPLPALNFKRHYDADMKRNEEIFGIRVSDDEKWVNAEELGVSMLENYIDEYGDDSVWEVLVTEHPFQTLVRRPKPTDYSHDWHEGDPWFIYTGVLDGIWRHRVSKELWIPDHKTTDGIGEKKWTHLALDDQAGGYWSWGLDYLYKEGFLKKNQQLHGMLYNLLRKALPDERASKFVGNARVYLNLDGTVSKRQPPAYFKRITVFRDEFDRDQARRRSMIDFQRIEMFRSGQLEISKTPGMFTCPMCPIRDACELHETGNDYGSFIKETTQGWDPYAEHEVYDGR